MKRIVFAIIIASANVSICLAAGAHADERFAEDVTITNSIVEAGEYENAVFVKNLTLINTIVRKEAFKKVVIVGDLTISGCTVANDAFAEMTLIGQQSVDDATVYFDDTASSGNNGAVFTDDVVIIDPVIADNAYAGAIFLGNLSIQSTLVGSSAFAKTLVMGNLTVNASRILDNSFNGVVVNGTTTALVTTVGANAFEGAVFKGKVNLYDFSQFEGVTWIGWDYETEQEYEVTSYYTFYKALFSDGLELDCQVELPADVFSLSGISNELSYDSDVTLFAPKSFSRGTFNNLTIRTKSIVPYLFYGADFGGSLSLAEGLKTIGEGAFANAKKIGQLSLPASVEEIGNRAFYKANVTGQLALNDNSSNIGDEAFAYCDISSAVIPASVTTIPTRFFKGCKSLSEIHFADDENLIKIGVSSFYGTALPEIVIPSSVTEIGDSAFFTAKATKIVLPTAISKVGKLAFEQEEQVEDGTYPQISRWVYIPEKTRRLNLFHTGINTRDRLIVWSSPLNQKALPLIRNDYDYYSTWTHVEVIGDETYYSGERNDKWLKNGIYQELFAQGFVYVPIGLKSLMQSQILDQYDAVPSLSLLPDDHWIEIQMGEYPNCQLSIVGDLNGDGSVDGGDVSILLEMVLAGGVTDEQKAVADLNGDGDVDGGDVSILLEMVLSGE